MCLNPLQSSFWAAGTPQMQPGRSKACLLHILTPAPAPADALIDRLWTSQGLKGTACERGSRGLWEKQQQVDMHDFCFRAVDACACCRGICPQNDAVHLHTHPFTVVRFAMCRCKATGEDRASSSQGGKHFSYRLTTLQEYACSSCP